MHHWCCCLVGTYAAIAEQLANCNTENSNAANTNISLTELFCKNLYTMAHQHVTRNQASVTTCMLWLMGVPAIAPIWQHSTELAQCLGLRSIDFTGLTTSGANCLMIFIVPAERRQAKVVPGSKNVFRLLERMHVCVRVQTADCSDKRSLVTRRIKASQMLQSIVCAFRSTRWCSRLQQKI